MHNSYGLHTSVHHADHKGHMIRNGGWNSLSFTVVIITTNPSNSIKHICIIDNKYQYSSLQDLYIYAYCYITKLECVLAI